MGKKGLDMMRAWASFPLEENCLQAKNYNELPSKVTLLLADMCTDLGCRETYEDAKAQDYIGCQAKTRSGLGCQKWTVQNPHAHNYKRDWWGRWPAKYADKGILGGHNYCRNPDGKDTIWCYTMDPETRWEYCDAPMPTPPGGELF